MMKSFTLFLLSIVLLSCGGRKLAHDEKAKDTVFAKGSFGYDLAFLKKHKEVIVLGDSMSTARIAVVRDYQGRVMTSTAMGDQGNSYGWLNYNLIESGKNQPHINPIGGEDRFWLGPEGGQYAVFFSRGSAFDFEHWQTPALIDSEPFDLVSSTSHEAVFRKSATLKNYSGYEFQISIDRKIRLLDNASILDIFGVAPSGLKSVSFQSENTITNTGKEAWSRKSGLLSIWILGMYNPSDGTTIVMPYEKTKDPQSITDNYFGAIPGDRLKKTDSVLFLKGDGKFRGKVGISPHVAKNIAGSYDALHHILTLVKFDVDKKGDYVNSKWEQQKAPYAGDVANSYNDGPLADGGQLGPFYELESSSAVRELKPGESLSHRHSTLHLEGDEAALDAVARGTLGISLKEISQVWK